MPHPISPKNPAPFAAAVIAAFYLFGLLLLIGSVADRSLGLAVVGGILLAAGVYHSAQWVRAKRRDEEAGRKN